MLKKEFCKLREILPHVWVVVPEVTGPAFDEPAGSSSAGGLCRRSLWGWIYYRQVPDLPLP